MVNNLILVILLIIILIFYAGQNFGGAFAASFVYLTCAPLMVIGEQEINNSYPLTALLVILTFISWLRRPEKRPRSYYLRLFAVSMGAVLVAYLIGFFLNGTASLQTFEIAYAGEINVFLLVIALSMLLFRVEQQDVMKVMFRSILIFVIVNTAVSVLQKLNVVYAYRMMDRFYVSESRFKPLLVMISGGSYDRVSGTFFSPVVFGSTLLMAVVLLTAWIIRQNSRKIRWGAVTLIAVMTVGGILSFSKLFMLGVPVMMVYWAIYLLFFAKNRRQKLSNWALMLVVFVIVYVGVYFALPKDMMNIRDYYYQYFTNPLAALNSRYAGIEAPQVAFIDDLPIKEEGIVTGAFDYFKQHPIFGVGPVQVEQEFLGDSQVIMAAHHGGVVALAAYLYFYLYTYVQAFRRRNLYSLSLIPVLAIGSLASVMLTMPSILPFVAFIIRWGDYSGKLVVGEDGLIHDEGDLRLHMIK